MEQENGLTGEGTKETSSPPGSSGANRIWFCGLTVCCAGLLLFFAVEGARFTDPSTIVGESLGNTFWAWLVFFLIFVKGRVLIANAGVISFFALFLAIFAGRYVSLEHAKLERKDFAVTALAKLHSLREQADQPLSRARLSSEPNTGTAVTAITFEDWLLKLLGQVELLGQEYNSELDEIGWEGILDPVKLSKPGGLAHAIKTAQEAQLILNRHLERLDAQIQVSKNELRQLPLSSPQRERIIEQFESGINTTNDGVTQWQLEAQILQEVEAILEFLSNDSKWEVQDGTFVFSSEHYANVYNRKLLSLYELADKQGLMQRQALNQFERSLLQTLEGGS